VLTAWFAVHGLATLRIDGALPKKGLNPERLAPIVTTLLSSMLAALACKQPSASRLSRRPARPTKAVREYCRKRHCSSKRIGTVSLYASLLDLVTVALQLSRTSALS